MIWGLKFEPHTCRSYCIEWLGWVSIGTLVIRVKIKMCGQLTRIIKRRRITTRKKKKKKKRKMDKL